MPHARVVTIAAGAASARSLPEDLPGSVVLLGLCGALRPLDVGAWVVCSAACDAAGDVALETDAVARLRTVRPDLHVERGFTAPAVVTRVREKAALAQRYDAGVVDMEGTHVARALAARGIGMTMARVVSDGLAADLPPIEDAFDAEGALRPLALAAAFAREPVAAARFVADVRRALRELGPLARALTEARA